MNYLLHYPISEVKIDRSFVSGLESAERYAEMVRWIIALCREMQIEVVAEGVETEGQHEALKKMGCKQGQGYLHAVPVEEVPEAGTGERAKPGRRGMLAGRD